MKYMITILLLICTMHSYGQTLISFEYSDCKNDDLGMTSQVDEIIVRDNITMIALKTLGNCNGDFVGDWFFDNGKLDLRFSVKPVKIQQNDGSYEEFLELADCDCFFDFKYQINGLEPISKDSLTINGLSINQINASRRFEEIDFNIDED